MMMRKMLSYVTWPGVMICGRQQSSWRSDCARSRASAALRSASVDVLDRGARSGRRRVPIKVGISNGTRTQVIEGLKEGDRVVLPN